MRPKLIDLEGERRIIRRSERFWNFYLAAVPFALLAIAVAIWAK